jgi:hypothetical protein
MLHPIATAAIAAALVGGAASQMSIDIAELTLQPQASIAVDPDPARPGEQPSVRACRDARAWLTLHGIQAERWQPWRAHCTRYRLTPE